MQATAIFLGLASCAIASPATAEDQIGYRKVFLYEELSLPLCASCIVTLQPAGSGRISLSDFDKKKQVFDEAIARDASITIRTKFPGSPAFEWQIDVFPPGKGQKAPTINSCQTPGLTPIDNLIFSGAPCTFYRRSFAATATDRDEYGFFRIDLYYEHGRVSRPFNREDVDTDIAYIAPTTTQNPDGPLPPYFDCISFGRPSCTVEVWPKDNISLSAWFWVDHIPESQWLTALNEVRAAAAKILNVKE